MTTTNRFSFRIAILIVTLVALIDCISFAQLSESRITPFGILPAGTQAAGPIKNSLSEYLPPNVWESIGPNGISVRSIAVDPQNTSVIYVGGLAGLYKTTNGGSFWGLVSDQFQNQDVTSITIHPTNPNTLFAKTTGFENSIFRLRLRKSTDAGGTWSTLREGTAYLFNDEGVLINPLNTQMMYVVLDSIYKTTNGGITWRVIAPFGNIALYRPIPSVLYRTHRDSLYWSIDYGENWSFKGVLPNYGFWFTYVILVSPTDPNTLFLGSKSFDGGFYRTTNGGVNWTTLISGFGRSKSVAAIAIDPSDPNVMYAGGYANGVYRTTNRGDQWTLISSSVPDRYTLALILNSTGNLYCGTGAGLFSSTNQGSNWESLTGNLRNLDVFNVLPHPQDSSIIYASSLGGAHRSTDGGISWQQINNGLLDTDLFALALDPTNPSTLYAGTYGGLVYKTTDGGNIWTEKTNGLPPLGNNYVFAIRVHPKDPSWIWTGGFQSTNGGESWFPLTFLGRNVYQLTFDPSHPDTLYTTFGDTLLRSMNRGVTWSVRTSGIYLSKITVNPNDPNTLYANANGISRSTNGGLSWQLVDSTYATSFHVNPQHSSYVYASTFYTGIRRSTNAGNSWVSYNNGLQYTSVFSVRSATGQPHTLFAATYGGSIYRVDETYTSVKNESVVADRFELKQNYPNPFNPITVIQYSLPIPSYTKLKMYDVLGRAIATIVDELKASGSYIATWDASAFASGVYFCRLQAAGFVQTRRLVLLR